MPPEIHSKWDDNNVWEQAQIIAYSQIRDYEDQQERITLYKALGCKI